MFVVKKCRRSKMKRIWKIKFAATIFALVSAPAVAQIEGTAHDLTTGSYDNTGNTGGQICVYCHTPHNATAITAGALWNRIDGAIGPYTMYPSGGTIQGAIDVTPNAETLACLGCHDGVAAMDNISNLPGRDPDVTWGATTGPLLGYALLDDDLSDDHPVSIVYDVADTELDTVANAITGSALELYNGKVECATCHDVHGTAFPQFLRITSDTSDICLTCHLK